MDATIIERAIQQLKSEILTSIRHKTLLQHIEKPLQHDYQLFFLLLPKLNGENWDEQVNLAATTVGIVHASLAEHAKIQEQRAISKTQQLTVLSGDYYSGRYYQILANTGNLSFIRVLSDGIVARCEQEMAVYEHESRTLSDWISSLATVEAALIERFLQTFNFDLYIPLTISALTVIRLQQELDKYQHSESLFIEKMLQLDGVTLNVLFEQLQVYRQNLYEAVEASSLHSSLCTFIREQTENTLKL